MTVAIRPAQLNDYADIERLWLELNAHHADAEPDLIKRVETYQSEESFEAVLKDPLQEILTLCDEDELVGAVWLVERMHQGGQAIEMPVAFIQELCTRKSERRRGYGRLLMRAAEEWARDRGLVRLEFNVWANNDTALSFYEALGFGIARHEMFKPLD